MAYMANRNSQPASYKDASESFKMGLDEEQARVASNARPSYSSSQPATYKDASESYKMGLDEERAEVDRVASAYGSHSYYQGPPATYKDASESYKMSLDEEQAEVDRVAAAYGSHSYYQGPPATYKDASESYKMGLDEEQAEVDRVAAAYGHVDFNPLANNPRGSEMERLEAERLQAEHRNTKEAELAEKFENNEQISEEDMDYIYNSIMTGTLPLQQKKDGIAALIKNGKDDMIKNIIQNEAELSVEQMKMDKNGYVSQSQDRNLEFMETLTILKENNYDFNKVKFVKNDKEMDFYRFIGSYANKASEYNAKMSEAIVSDVVNQRVAYSPMLIATLFIEEEYLRNPQRFEEEYQAYIAPKKEGEFRISYEEFIRNRYHIEINRLADKLKVFEEERNKVIAQDNEKRRQMFAEQTLESDNSKIFENVEEESVGKGR